MNIEVCKQSLQQRYEIIGELGQGGMGKVFRAQDTQLDRQVAIKIPLPPDGAGEKWQQIETRFRREGRTLAKLKDPSIMQVYDLGTAGGLPYMISEWIDGKSLIPYPKPWSSAAITHLARDLCTALAHAHNSGVIHRDIKPANILIRNNGAPVLIDFGIARFINDDPLTQTGTVLGTLIYLAPELLLSKVTDESIDQYSLGSVLYELAVGHTWVKSDTLADTVQSIMRSTPEDIMSLRPDFDLQVARFIHRMLEKEPEDRFPTMKQATLAWNGLIPPGSKRVPPPPCVAESSDFATAATDSLSEGLAENTIAYQGDTPPPEILSSATKPKPPEQSPAPPVQAPNTAAVQTLLIGRRRALRVGTLFIILLCVAAYYFGDYFGLLGKQGSNIAQSTSQSTGNGVADSTTFFLEPGLSAKDNLAQGHEAYERGHPKNGLLYYQSALANKPRLKTDSVMLEHVVESMAGGDADAMQLLKTHQSKKAVTALLKRSEGPGYEERERTIKLLESLGQGQNINYGKVATLTLADGPDCDSRLRAIKIIDKFKYRRAIPELRALLNTSAWDLKFPVVCLKQEATRTLNKLESMP